MRTFQRVLLMILLPLLPLSVAAQAVFVLGGGDKARECFMNAQIAGDINLGNGLLDACDYALEYVTLTLPDRAATLANRGIILTNQDKFVAAMNDFEKALALRPDAPEIYINRGNVFFHQSNFNMAIEDYTAAVDLNIEEMHIAYLDRGLAYERAGDAMMAEEDYRQALEYMPQWQIVEDLLANLLTKQQESESSL